MERLLLAGECAADGTPTGVWYVCTPDLDRYCEDLTTTGTGADSVVVWNLKASCPAGIKGKFYRFTPPTIPMTRSSLDGTRRVGIRSRPRVVTRWK